VPLIRENYRSATRGLSQPSSPRAPQMQKVEGTQLPSRIRAYPRAHQLEGAPHVVFKSQRGQLVGGIPPRESFRALGP
jgi:hypothetical protein